MRVRLDDDFELLLLFLDDDEVFAPMLLLDDFSAFADLELTLGARRLGFACATSSSSSSASSSASLSGLCARCCCAARCLALAPASSAAPKARIDLPLRVDGGSTSSSSSLLLMAPVLLGAAMAVHVRVVVLVPFRLAMLSVMRVNVCARVPQG